MSDSKDTVIVTKDGSAGWFVAVIAIAALLLFGYLAFSGYFTPKESVSIELSVPDLPTPSE